MGRNSELNRARVGKNDEFYTDMSDVSKEMVCHRERFRGKTVFLNCDDPVTSAFWEYFHLNFGFLGLRRLVATHYDARLQDQVGQSEIIPPANCNEKIFGGVD